MFLVFNTKIETVLRTKPTMIKKLKTGRFTLVLAIGFINNLMKKNTIIPDESTLPKVPKDVSRFNKYQQLTTNT